MLVENKFKECSLCRDGLYLQILNCTLLVPRIWTMVIWTFIVLLFNKDIEVLVKVNLLAHVVQHLVEFVEDAFRYHVCVHWPAPNHLAGGFQQLSVKFAHMLRKGKLDGGLSLHEVI